MVTYRLQVKNIVLNTAATNVVVTDNIGELLAAASLASVIVVLQKKKRKETF